MKYLSFLLIILLSYPANVLADQEAGNRTYVRSSEWGQFYVKSIPEETYGLKGRTLVYQVSENEDKLLFTHPWYSPEIYVWGFKAGPIVYTVQFGPWHRGRYASEDHLAIAIYKNEQLVKKYSTLEIAKEKDKVGSSVSHYMIFRNKLGFRRPWGNQIVFDVKKYDESLVSFNMDTGEMMTLEQEQIGKAIYETRSKIQQLKWKWYQANDGKIDNIKEYEITEDDLKALDTDNYPIPPKGYKIIPNKMWKQVDVNPL